jgi:hypothetical protein
VQAGYRRAGARERAPRARVGHAHAPVERHGFDELILAFHHGRDERDAQALRCWRDGLQERRRGTRCSRNAVQHGHPCDAGRGLFEYLDQLSIDRLVYVEAKSGEVAAGSCQALA